MRNPNLLVEPCGPYDMHPAGNNPVEAYEIVYRLTEQELRELVISYAIFCPAGFEDKLHRMGERRARRRSAECFTLTENGV